MLKLKYRRPSLKTSGDILGTRVTISRSEKQVIEPGDGSNQRNTENMNFDLVFCLIDPLDKDLVSNKSSYIHRQFNFLSNAL